MAVSLPTARLVSVALLVSMVSSTVAPAAPRPAPRAAPTVSVHSAASSPAASSAARLADLIPLAAGTVRRVVEPAPGRPVVVFIQDIHRNAEAQRNIAAAVSSLGVGKRALLLALEGASGPLDFSRFASFPAPDSMAAAGEFLLSEGRLPGAVHVAMTAGGRSIRAVGIENEPLYSANVDAYRRASPAPAIAALSAFRSKLDARRLRWPARVRAFDDGVSAHAESRRTLSDHLRSLARLSRPGPEVARFLEAAGLESSIDWTGIDDARRRVLEAVSRRTTPAALAALGELAVRERAGRVRSGAFLESLSATARAAGVSGDPIEKLDRYARYARLAEEIDPERLLDEAARLEESAYATLLKGRDLETARDLRWERLATRLVRHGLGSSEWAAYRELRPVELDRSLAAALAPYEDFYRVAVERDAALATNVLGALSRDDESAVVVAGGFHSRGVLQRLERAGCGVVLFSPRLTRVDVDGAAYLSAFSSEKSPIDRLFEGTRLFLAPHPGAASGEAALLATAHAVWSGSASRPTDLLSSVVPPASGWRAESERTGRGVRLAVRGPRAGVEADVDVAGSIRSVTYRALNAADVTPSQLGRLITRLGLAPWLDGSVRFLLAPALVPHELGHFVEGRISGRASSESLGFWNFFSHMPWATPGPAALVGLAANGMAVVVASAIALAIEPSLVRTMFVTVAVMNAAMVVIDPLLSLVEAEGDLFAAVSSTERSIHRLWNRAETFYERGEYARALWTYYRVRLAFEALRVRMVRPRHGELPAASLVRLFDIEKRLNSMVQRAQFRANWIRSVQRSEDVMVRSVADDGNGRPALGSLVHWVTAHREGIEHGRTHVLLVTMDGELVVSHRIDGRIDNALVSHLRGLEGFRDAAVRLLRTKGGLASVRDEALVPLEGVIGERKFGRLNFEGVSYHDSDGIFHTYSDENDNREWGQFFLYVLTPDEARDMRRLSRETTPGATFSFEPLHGRLSGAAERAGIVEQVRAEHLAGPALVRHLDRFGRSIQQFFRHAGNVQLLEHETMRVLLAALRRTENLDEVQAAGHGIGVLGVSSIPEIPTTPERLRNGSPPGVLVFDVDKTLADRDARLPESIRKRLRALMKAGYRIVIISGQPVNVQYPRIVSDVVMREDQGASQVGGSERFTAQELDNLVMYTNEGSQKYVFENGGPSEVADYRKGALGDPAAVERVQGIVRDLFDDLRAATPALTDEELAMAAQAGLGSIEGLVEIIRGRPPRWYLRGTQLAFKYADFEKSPDSKAMRTFLKLVILSRFRSEGIEGLTIATGGKSTVGILPEGVDKRTAMEDVFADLAPGTPVVYFGDEFEEGGNDYSLARMAAEGAKNPLLVVSVGVGKDKKPLNPEGTVFAGAGPAATDGVLEWLEKLSSTGDPGEAFRRWWSSLTQKGGTPSLLASLDRFFGASRSLTLVVRAVMAVAIVPHELGHWIEGKLAGRSGTVRLSHFFSAMPWQSPTGLPALAGLAANALVVVLAFTLGALAPDPFIAAAADTIGLINAAMLLTEPVLSVAARVGDTHEALNPRGVEEQAADTAAALLAAVESGDDAASLALLFDGVTVGIARDRGLTMLDRRLAALSATFDPGWNRDRFAAAFRDAAGRRLGVIGRARALRLVAAGATADQPRWRPSELLTAIVTAPGDTTADVLVLNDESGPETAARITAVFRGPAGTRRRVIVTSGEDKAEPLREVARRTGATIVAAPNAFLTEDGGARLVLASLFTALPAEVAGCARVNILADDRLAVDADGLKPGDLARLAVLLIDRALRATLIRGTSLPALMEAARIIQTNA